VECTVAGVDSSKSERPMRSIASLHQDISSGEQLASDLSKVVNRERCSPGRRSAWNFYANESSTNRSGVPRANPTD
jgi:hypothetical protein